MCQLSSELHTEFRVVQKYLASKKVSFFVKKKLLQDYQHHNRIFGVSDHFSMTQKSQDVVDLSQNSNFVG